MSIDQDRIHPLFQKVNRQLGKLATMPGPKNVHQFRTATRRIEVLLEELVSKQDRNQRKLLKLLSRLRRRAGRVRDLDVQVAALRTLKIPQEPGRKAELLRGLGELRGKREKKLVKALDRETFQEIRKRLRRAEADLNIADNGPEPLALAWRVFARLASQQGPLTEEVLHRYRMNGKRIRYLAELSGNTAEAQPMVAQLKRMQDALGEWHDWLTLTQAGQKQLGDSSSPALIAMLNNITRAKFRDAMQVVTETKVTLGHQPVAIARRTGSTPQALRRKPASLQTVAAAAIA